MPRDAAFPDAPPGSAEALLQAALDWAARGFRVFPLVPEGKTPAFEGWQQSATTDPDTIRSMWSEMTGLDAQGRVVPRPMPYNVGYVTDHLVVIDIDTKKDPNAHQIYQDELLGDFDTLEVRTTSGGTHLIYSWPAGDRATRVNLEDLPIDTKARGGLAVAPGSVFANGFYRLAVDRPVKPLPPHLIKRIPLARVRGSQTDIAMDLDRPSAVAWATRQVQVHPAAVIGGRGFACYKLAALLRDYGVSIETAKQLINEYWSPRCDPPFPFENEKDVEGADVTISHAYDHAQNSAGSKSAEAQLGDVVRLPTPPAPPAPPATTMASDAERLTVQSTISVISELTEDGAATCFLKRYAGVYRRDWDTGRDHWWDGSVWHHDKRNFALAAMRETLRDIITAQEAKPGELTRMSKAATATGALKYVQSDPAVAVTNDIWDVNLHLLGTPAGTIDLSINELRPAHPSDGITKLTAVAPDARATPIWDAFLHEVTGGDQALIDFLQRAAGYTLTGLTTEHAVFFLHGPGGNGKSVFVNVLLTIMGDYGQAATMDAFTVTHGEKHLTFVATLAGGRMVVATETEQGKAWAEARVKQMSGGDKITANFMRRDPFSFWPRFKLWIVGNYVPNLSNVDHAMRRRINIIPFTHTPAVPDPRLEERLRTELPGILMWMIRGCAMWQRDGLQRPPIVLQATEQYFEAQDVFGTWMAERTTLDSEARTRPSHLLGDLNTWLKQAGEPVVSYKTLRGWIERQKGLQHVKVKGDTFVKGIRLTSGDAIRAALPTAPVPPPPPPPPMVPKS